MFRRIAPSLRALHNAVGQLGLITIQHHQVIGGIDLSAQGKLHVTDDRAAKPGLGRRWTEEEQGWWRTGPTGPADSRSTRDIQVTRP
jgi:hypothetical protein